MLTKLTKIKIPLLIVFLGFTLFLSLNRHSKSGIQNYHSEIWADKAGYYVYLPWLFIYGLNTTEMPTDIDKKTGNGFSIQDGKIITKYTYGVALMQAPCFLICHGLSSLLGYKDDGFTIPYHKAINISAVLYSFFSLILLYFFLLRYLNIKTTIYTLICLYLGTNIFYYSLIDTGMSHVYSLFLFACFLYLGRYIGSGEKKTHYILFGLVIGLIIIVRPLNILFLPVYFVFNSIQRSDLQRNSTHFLLAILATLAVITPQLLYWKYSSGNYIQYSYGAERFSNLLNPQLIKLFFSTNNGLFIYNPLLIFTFVGLFYLYRKSTQKGATIGIYFLLISYVFSSWHDWTYGCSYGCRPYVEYLTLLALPFGHFIEKLTTSFPFKRIVIALIISYIILNQKLIFSYDGCWFGGTWDWPAFLDLMLSKPK